jgi:hypothetical protein
MTARIRRSPNGTPMAPLSTNAGVPSGSREALAADEDQ